MNCDVFPGQQFVCDGSLTPALININGRIYRKNQVQRGMLWRRRGWLFIFGSRFVYQSVPLPWFICVFSMASYNVNVLFHSSWVQCLDEPCDTYSIEQTDRGFRCAIDVPSGPLQVSISSDHSPHLCEPVSTMSYNNKKVTLT